jgi:hypothetical protein
MNRTVLIDRRAPSGGWVTMAWTLFDGDTVDDLVARLRAAAPGYGYRAVNR